MTLPARPLSVEAPHCPTCTCSLPWRRYSPRSNCYRTCRRCQASTERPGPDRWWWRPRVALERSHTHGRSTESLCEDCGAREIP